MRIIVMHFQSGIEAQAYIQHKKPTDWKVVFGPEDWSDNDKLKVVIKADHKEDAKKIHNSVEIDPVGTDGVVVIFKDQ